ncbi:MAG: hypothetical protein ABW082_01355 [Sedimenticola sp.]
MKAEYRYYLNYDRALEAANRHPVEIEKLDSLPSIIYTNVPLPPEHPINLVHVPLDSLASFLTNTNLPAPDLLDTEGVMLPPPIINSYREQFVHHIDQAQQIIQNSKLDERHNRLIEDTYFLDRDVALLVSLMENRVYLDHPDQDGLQMCFYDGEPFNTSQKNLINVKKDNYIDYFTHTTYRIPTKIVLQAQITENRKSALSEQLRDAGKVVADNRDELFNHYHQLCRKRDPGRADPERLRIFLPANRLTNVMQFASKGLATALEKLGHEVLYLVEKNDMEQLHFHVLKAHHDFNPNVVININHINNEWLHENTYNIVWWQDPMPELFENDEDTYRNNDIIFTIDSRWIDKLPTSKQKEACVQSFCIDENVFHQNYNTPRQEKIIFVGSSYRRWYENSSQLIRMALNSLIDEFESGAELTNDLIEFHADKYNVPDHELKRHRLTYVVRDTSVRWMCEQGVTASEVYGRGWEYDPTIKEHFKGELLHGEAVAEAYNNSEYALCCIPGHIYSQRLAELTACGCTPIVYDSRYSADPPYFEDQCLYYTTKESLIEQLDRKPSLPPHTISDNYTYMAFAKRIVSAISRHSGTDYTSDQ